MLDKILSRLAALLKIPPLAVTMFRAANEASGLDRSTIPTELIPLNTLQLARGLLNFTLLQSLDGWVVPYWAVRQYDPRDPGFVPRSHLGLSINVTRRNWTAVGSPECAVEPVVDPRGLVTPFRDGWSIDVWLRVRDRAFFPSHEEGVDQRLVQNCPIVKTAWVCGGIRLESTSYVAATTLIILVEVTNTALEPLDCAPAFAIRPFNPEGASLLHEIAFDRGANAFVLPEDRHVRLSGAPSQVHCSTLRGGDAAGLFSLGKAASGADIASCPAGLANGFASYAFRLLPGERKTLTATVPLGRGAPSVREPARVAEEWTKLLGTGTSVTTPDDRLNGMLRASLATLLVLTDGGTVTPGPWTYHQFWFRDAAIMLHALDAFGFHSFTRPVIGGFPSRQDKNGYFRSQKGEWDSNGQALWTVWQHTVLSHDDTLAAGMFEQLRSGVEWIRRKRLTDKGERWDGLLPRGLSAEHLGLADFYFWDDWWSAAGIQAYVRLAGRLGREAEAESAGRLLAAFRGSIERAISAAQVGRGIREIPAGPLRGVDCGMIGACAAWHPLQELPPSDVRMRATLETLQDRYMMDGLFFQNFIHSGGNPYLSLQMAHAWLYAGERGRFWTMVKAVIRSASPTMNFPEAIHPRTGGGVMGDGHHGWAAAELVLALRAAFIQEVWDPGRLVPDLVLLGGAPPEWFDDGARCAVSRAPVTGGLMSVDAVTRGSVVHVELAFECAKGPQPRVVMLRLPFVASHVSISGNPEFLISVQEGETIIEGRSLRETVVIECERERPGNLSSISRESVAG